MSGFDEASLSGIYAQLQELLQSHHRDTLTFADGQRRVISELRKEIEDLHVQLGVASSKETEAGGLTEVVSAGQAPPERPTSRLPPDRLLEGFAPATDGEPIDGRPVVLPGQVQRAELQDGVQSRANSKEPIGIVPNAPSVSSCSQKSIGDANWWFARRSAVPGDPARPTRSIFADASSMKERVRQAILKPDYHVSNYYKTTGVWQYIARTTVFESFTLVVIFLNSIWIAVDTDQNPAPVIFQATWVFQLVEHSFFAYFMFEWVTRFLAFENKKNCMRDAWFVFDTCLVGLMIIDNWVISVVLWAMGGSGSVRTFPIIRILRLLRLTRMMRMARLLRAAPELMILVKGMAGAVRSVGFTLLLLLGIIYVFSIAFRTLTEGTSVGDRYFSTVPKAAFTLLLDGTLPDLASIVYNVADEHILYAVLLIIFILIATLTVMNMLVGVLVEVVTTVSSVEKEHMEAVFLKGHMLHFLQVVDEDGDVFISKDEFGRLLEKPKAIKALQEVGVDVIGLAELCDFIYKDRQEMTFPDFMETVLQLRGTNIATVKSIVDMRMYMTQELSRVEDNLSAKLAEVTRDLPAWLPRGRYRMQSPPPTA